MITVRIGTSERSIDTADESWINEQINRRRHDGVMPCVRVTIDQELLNMILSTPGCPIDVRGGRPPNVKEREVLDLWDRQKLNTSDFTGGNLTAFLKQLHRLVS